MLITQTRILFNFKFAKGCQCHYVFVPIVSLHKCIKFKFSYWIPFYASPNQWNFKNIFIEIVYLNEFTQHTETVSNHLLDWFSLFFWGIILFFRTTILSCLTNKPLQEFPFFAEISTENVLIFSTTFNKIYDFNCFFIENKLLLSLMLNVFPRKKCSF